MVQDHNFLRVYYEVFHVFAKPWSCLKSVKTSFIPIKNNTCYMAMFHESIVPKFPTKLAYKFDENLSW